jgi:Flp pilus assembly pilin Flp
MRSRISGSLKKFLGGIDGQDLVEYTLLLAFVALVGISVVIGAGGSVHGIWGSANTSLVAANLSASGSSGNPQNGGHHGGDGGSGDGGSGDGH